jgi:hypothetical protein
MRHGLYSYFYLIQCLLLTLSAGQSAQFLYPTGNETYDILDTIEVQWKSDFQSATLFAWCYNSLFEDAFARMSLFLLLPARSR